LHGGKTLKEAWENCCLRDGSWVCLEKQRVFYIQSQSIQRVSRKNYFGKPPR
jgi:hypothetical protein